MVIARKNCPQTPCFLNSNSVYFIKIHFRSLCIQEESIVIEVCWKFTFSDEMGNWSIAMLGSHLPKARRFSYVPLYYDPEKDETEGHQIKFRRRRSKAGMKHRSVFWLLLLLGLLIYLMFFLVKIGRS